MFDLFVTGMSWVSNIVLFDLNIKQRKKSNYFYLNENVQEGLWIKIVIITISILEKKTLFLSFDSCCHILFQLLAAWVFNFWMGNFSVQNATQCGAFLPLLEEMNLRLAWTTWIYGPQNAWIYCMLKLQVATLLKNANKWNISCWCFLLFIELEAE